MSGVEDSAHAKIPPRNQLQANVNVCIDRASNPQAIYKFQNPKSFSFKRRNDEPGSRVHEKGMPMHPSKKRKAECDCDERDVELLRMIQRASRKPQIKDEGKPVAPNDELLINTLQTAEDAIAFFSANGSKSDVKYILLNRKSRKLEFRPYDLLVVPNGSEDPEHYIMSATGVVHIHPGYPSEVVSIRVDAGILVVYCPEKNSLFQELLALQSVFRLHQNLRARQYAATRKRLAKDFLLTTHTFSGHGLDLAKATYELSSVPIIMYEPQGKHDYFVDEFSLQQSKQRQKGASAFNTIVEKIEGKLGKLIEVLQRRADVPDLNTQEALEQYLQANAITDGKEAGGKRKIRSMLDAKRAVRKMRELKRSITLLNTLRRQHLEEIRTLGFQVLLVPTDVSMLFNPTEDNVKELCNEVFTGCTDVVGNANRLCDQRFFKSYFSKTPKIWNISSELKRDARINYIQESTLNLVHEDYEQANNRMTTYATTLPHIHFLLKEWPVIEQEWKEQQNEEILSCQSLTKIYQRLQEAQNALRLKSEIEPRMHVLREGIDSTLRITTCNLIKELNTYFKQKTQQLNLRPKRYILMGSTKLDNDVAQAEALCDVMDRQQVEFLEDEDKQLKERTLGNTTTSAVSLHVIFDEARLHADEFIEENMAAHIETLQSEVANVEEECAGVQQILSGEDFSAISDNTEGMLECLADIKGRIDAIKSGEEELTRFGRLFDVPPFDWTIVSDVTSLYNARQDMWSLLDMFNKKIEYWFDCPVKVLNTQEMEEEVNLMIRRAGNGNRVMAEKSYEDELAQHLSTNSKLLGSTYHWNIVLKAMTGAAYSYHDGLSLRTLQERNVFHFKEVLAEQSGLATGEWKITNDLDLIKQVWDGINFGTKSYKNLDGVYILDSLDEIIQQLDDHQIELQTIMASRF
eukprot:gene12918-8775_t